jgi:hypothetical protein
LQSQKTIPCRLADGTQRGDDLRAIIHGVSLCGF